MRASDGGLAADQDAGAQNSKNDARAAIPGKRRLARWIIIGNATGAPVADRTNIMTGGPRGWPVTPLFN
jgi:hypothetical protein